MIFNAWGTAEALRLEKSANDWKLACSNNTEVLLNKELNPKQLQCCSVINSTGLWLYCGCVSFVRMDATVKHGVFEK